jgi:hypothetical protein
MGKVKRNIKKIKGKNSRKNNLSQKKAKKLFSRISKMQGIPIVGAFSPTTMSMCSGTGTGYCSAGAHCQCC